MEVAAGRPGGGPLRRSFLPGSTSTMVLYAVALLLACGCVVGGVLSYRTYQDRQDEKAEQERYGDVVSAATGMAEAFINIDYRDVDATYEAVSARATGAFRDEYTKALGQEGQNSGADTLVGLLTEAKSVMTGEVVNAAVSSLDKDSARVLIVTDGTVTNTQPGEGEPTEQARSFRLALDLVRTDGKWLTNNLEFVG
jgi:Mce-associated membrane protein